MSQELPKGLEVRGDTFGLWIRCKKCSVVFCQVGDDWRIACEEGSPGQLACPGCGALLVEKVSPGQAT
jgi:hypothetical protein